MNFTFAPTLNLAPFIVNVILPPAALSTSVGLTEVIAGGLSILIQAVPF